MKVLPVFAGSMLAATAIASAVEPGASERMINEFRGGSISKEDGLKYWQKFFEVASHPCCVTCHVGFNSKPMWSGKSYGERRLHGMGVTAGRSCIGTGTVSY